MTVIDRFMAKVMPEPTGGCWLWLGAISAKGYGRFGLRGRNRLAYNVAYELFVGPIPDDGLVFDHVCEEKSCVNPAHLQRVTNRVNVQRYFQRRPARTHCARGHDLTEDNVYVFATGRRECRTCVRAYSNAWAAHRRAALSTH